MSALLRPMRARDEHEDHRASTPLELFFDLTFVVGVSLAASELAHQIEAGHPGRGLGLFAVVFFAIWWGWLNFTWFASAYDTDDWLYRVVTLVQMSGALVVAAGIPKVFATEDFAIMVVGYVVMRLAMTFQWLRAARNDPLRRRTALTYAIGITLVQLLWVVRLALPGQLALPALIVLIVAELAVPPIAERRRMTSYHPRHITERYGLFTIIVLGEGVLAASNSIINALNAGDHVATLVGLSGTGLVLLAGMWWLYFAFDSADEITTFAGAIIWGYGHYVVFAAAAAVSSGIEVQVAAVTGHSHAGPVVARLAISLPAAIFVLTVWALVVRPAAPRTVNVAAPLAAVLLLATALPPLSPVALAATDAALVAGLIAYVVTVRGVT